MTTMTAPTGRPRDRTTPRAAAAPSRSAVASWSPRPSSPACSPSSAPTPTRPPASRATEMFEIYTDNPEPLQFKSLGFHWSYAFWIVPAFMAAAYVRGRGAWLANIAAFIGFVGMTTLPGLLFIDWYDSAIGQVYGVEAVDRRAGHR